MSVFRISIPTPLRLGFPSLKEQTPTPRPQSPVSSQIPPPPHFFDDVSFSFVFGDSDNWWIDKCLWVVPDQVAEVAKGLLATSLAL